LNIDTKKTIGYLKLLIVVSIWGGTYHVAKYMIEYADIFTVSYLRFLVASTILVIMLYRKNGWAGFTSKPKHHWFLLFMVGFVGIFLYNMGFLGAETLISPNTVATIFAFTPCLAVLLSVIFLKQKLNLLGYFGIIIALAGVLAIIKFTGGDCGKVFCSDGIEVTLGEWLALLSAFSMAVYNILNKLAAKQDMNPLTVTTFGAVFGTICLGIAFLIYGKNLNYLYNVPWLFWLALIYLSVFATVICYKWYSEAIHEIGVAKTVVFQSGVPVAAIFIGITFAGDTLSNGVFVAGVVVIFGVLTTNMALNKN
jgi:drug/metabolite transporter (DMT)-like permease